MTIQSERISKSALVLLLSGRLDTATAPLLERKIKQWGDDITELILDFSRLTYISSMGLRVLLQTQKAMTAKCRRLVIKNMGESIREVFEMTGFINLIVQEEKFVVLRKEEPNHILLSIIGQMDSAGVLTLSKELTQIGEVNMAKEEDITVILDMEKLTSMSTTACHSLRQAITDTAWERRKLIIQNDDQDIRTMLYKEGLGDLIETGNP